MCCFDLSATQCAFFFFFFFRKQKHQLENASHSASGCCIPQTPESALSHTDSFHTASAAGCGQARGLGPRSSRPCSQLPASSQRLGSSPGGLRGAPGNSDNISVTSCHDSGHPASPCPAQPHGSQSGHQPQTCNKTAIPEGAKCHAPRSWGPLVPTDHWALQDNKIPPDQGDTCKHCRNLSVVFPTQTHITPPSVPGGILSPSPSSTGYTGVSVSPEQMPVAIRTVHRRPRAPKDVAPASDSCPGGVGCPAQQCPMSAWLQITPVHCQPLHLPWPVKWGH